MYLKDPKNGEQSVTLTFTVIAFVLLAGFSVASVLGYSKEPGPLMELFYASAALYFGRRFKVNDKTFSGKEKQNE